MGTTRTETGISEKRNYTCVSLNRVYTLSFCALTALITANIIGPIAERSSNHQTLKLCNERPLECKFKYDIIKYQETGKIPYTETKPNPTEKK